MTLVFLCCDAERTDPTWKVEKKNEEQKIIGFYPGDGRRRCIDGTNHLHGTDRR